MLRCTYEKQQQIKSKSKYNMFEVKTILNFRCTITLYETHRAFFLFEWKCPQEKKKHFVKTLDSSLSFEPNTNDYLQNAQKKTLL